MVRAIAQSIVNKDEALKAFDDYTKVNFPWNEKTKDREKKDFIALLQKEVKRGPIVISPHAEPKAKSRLAGRTKVVEATPGWEKRADDFFKKIGPAVQIQGR